MIIHLWRCLFFLFLLGPSAEAAPLTLRDAANYAMEHSPKISSAAKQAYVATLARKNAKAAFFPTIDLNTSLGRRGYIPNVPDYLTMGDGTRVYQSANPWTSAFGITASENLFDNFLTIDRYRQSLLGEEKASLEALETRDQALLDIANNFYQYSFDRRKLEIDEDQFGILKRQFDLVSQGYRQGLKSRKDYLRLRADINRAEVQLRQSRNIVENSRQSLFRVMGVTPEDRFRLDFAVDDSAPKMEAMPDLKVENHRQAKISELDLRSQDIEARIADRTRWPELSLSLGANYTINDFVGRRRDGLGEGFEGAANEQKFVRWNAELSLKYNIFDWGIRRRNAETARVQAEISANNRRDTLLQTGQEIEKLRLEFAQLTDTFRLNRELLDLEKVNHQTITTDYRQGKVEYLDYTKSLENLASARSQYLGNVFELKKAYLNFRYHQGTVYEAIFQE